MVDDDLLHQRQPQPRPPLLGREERIENLTHVGGTDARARVVDRDHDAPRRLAHRDVEAARRRAGHRLARVADQVEQRLPQLRLVGAHVGQPRRDVDGHHDVVLSQLSPRHVDD